MNRMDKINRILKISLISIFLIGFTLELYLFIDALITAFDLRSLKGAGRAQAEFFLLPMIIYGRPIGYIGLGILITNLVLDFLNMAKLNVKDILLYIGLIFMILIPFISIDLLLNILYSGWK